MPLIIPGSASPSIWPNVGLKSATLPWGGNPNAVVEHVCSQSWEHVSPSNQLDRGQERDTSLSFTHGLASGVMCIDLRQTFHSREQGKATCTVSNKLARN